MFFRYLLCFSYSFLARKFEQIKYIIHIFLLLIFVLQPSYLVGNGSRKCRADITNW